MKLSMKKIMNKGKIVAEGTPEEVKGTHNSLEDAYIEAIKKSSASGELISGGSIEGISA